VRPAPRPLPTPAESESHRNRPYQPQGPPPGETPALPLLPAAGARDETPAAETGTHKRRLGVHARVGTPKTPGIVVNGGSQRPLSRRLGADRELLGRYAAGDWCNAGAFDRCENERALRAGLGVGVNCRRPGAGLREVPSAQPLVRPTGSERQMPGSRWDSPEGLCPEYTGGQTCDNRG